MLTIEDTEPTSQQLSPVLEAFCAALRAAGYTGDIADDTATRFAYSTDNSIYQLLPPLILFPRLQDDLARIVEVGAHPQFQTIAFTARGGGTGTNGQSLAATVIVDTSRYLNRILEVDAANGLVRVEPGVVLAQLNQCLASVDFFFPPMISTASRATLGGMIGTDACGKGSRRYGRTHDYVESLEVTLANGQSLALSSLSAEAIANGAATGQPSALIAERLRAEIAPCREAVERVFPAMPRSLTGYNLRDAFPADGSVHLQHLFTGAEGTLGLVREATLKIRKRPVVKGLAVVGYSEFEAALADARTLLATEPSAIETIDERILRLARDDPGWSKIQHVLQDSPDARVINLVEYEGDSDDGVAEQLAALAEALAKSARRVSYYRVNDAAEAAELWSIRARSVGLLARQEGRRKPIPFIEDTVVPPERLPEYVARLRAVLDGYGIEYGMFGHVDVGCLHVRPALDMTDATDTALIRDITEAVVALLGEHQGLLWGEHGKGFRGEYAPAFFGDTLYPLLASVKRCFDPDNRMNPGKIVAPDGDPARIDRIDSVPLRGERDRQIPAAQRRDWAKAIDCNGNGVCFDWDARSAICPSYKITRDRVHSPKGRAGLTREWLRELAIQNKVPEQIRSRLLKRSRATSAGDFSHHVYDAMQGCLGCKACATQCPVHVDIPEQRARFLEIYHRYYRRPLRDHIAGRLEHLAPLAAAVAPLTNTLLESAPGRALTHRLGLTDLPRLYRDHGLRIVQREGVRVIAAGAIADLPADMLRSAVFVCPDAFTTYFDPPVLAAVCRLIAALDLTPVVLAYKPFGKALHVHGFLKRFAGAARVQAQRLEHIARHGRPVLAIDPSTALMYRDEYPRALPSDAWSQPQMLAQWLHDLPRPRIPSSASGETYRLVLHCTERTGYPAAADEWRAVFERFGLALEVVETGCCGMAGIYGHQTEHRTHSRGLYDMAWRNAVEALPPERVLATGYSCRSQVMRQSGFRPAHPAEVLAEHLNKQSGSGYARTTAE